MTNFSTGGLYCSTMMVDRGNALVFERITAKIATAVVNGTPEGQLSQSSGDEKTRRREGGEIYVVPSTPVAFLVKRSADSQTR